MNHALTTVVSVSIASLVLGSGCASSQTRAHTSTPSIEQTSEHELVDSNQTESFVQISSAHSDEFVIGKLYSRDAVPRYPNPVASLTMDEIQVELEAMYDLDQSLVGESLSPSDQPNLAQGTIGFIDRVHCDRLKEIVAHVGWPTREAVGLKATQGAYMVIQHAGHDNAFQNQCLSMMVDLVEQGELPASYVALLTDRIRVFQNQPQLFGTQMAMARNELGVMVPTPTVAIEDPEHLDDRRELMGMPPHSEFVGAIALVYQASLSDAGTAFAEVLTDE